jgi:hypothetical protein
MEHAEAKTVVNTPSNKQTTATVEASPPQPNEIKAEPSLTQANNPAHMANNTSQSEEAPTDSEVKIFRAKMQCSFPDPISQTPSGESIPPNFIDKHLTPSNVLIAGAFGVLGYVAYRVFGRD